MADFVCRCGTYIRAYVPPGTQVACTQCGAILTMGRAETPGDESASSSNQSTSHPRSKRSSKPLLIVGSVLSAAILSGGGWWFWSQTTKPPVQQPKPERTQTAITETPKVAKQDTPKQAKWSNIQDWIPSAEQIPQGPAIHAMAKEIIEHGSMEFSSGFWDQLDNQANGQSTAVLKRTDLESFLKKSGLQTLTSQDGVICDHWSVLAFHSDQNNTSVLVRYFREPIESDPNQSSQWIGSCLSMVTLDEFLAKTQAVFKTPSNGTTSTIPPPSEEAIQDTPINLYFTPSFGYLILVFQTQEVKVLWKDLIPLPGEIPLSRAVSGPSNGSPNNLDIFGEYPGNLDKPISGGFYFNNESELSNLPSQTRRLIASIPETRARRLAEIAEAATSDTSNLDSRMARFRKEFPNDMGADTLLISIWCTKFYAKRATESYDDSGRVYIDAAHRLFMKTSDPLLLEIKSRIYQSYGRRQDSEKSQIQAEQSGHRSFTLLEQRITEAVESKDKEKLVDYLGKLNDFVQSRSKSAISPQVQEQWNKRLAEWQTQSKTK